eukprot:CAMPEP_0181216628 /NCGR_PEP_ID=MMETSP1096-20121128/26696_1 /TAXON_ID=156174 ORGANISM="Chrysochromulina ericina, Strain CCMP281" /NCGR_SAMPLE_ID=MMETSP1096 /ASSEMBLY_ACC=CAM_ASM_000453 /LENGTH=62 /DNA_ID=CAMNT_0023308659 /DNA_START=71 /DNA_END=255 /DNA_ORIENTATION=+
MENQRYKGADECRTRWDALGSGFMSRAHAVTSALLQMATGAGWRAGVEVTHQPSSSCKRPRA